VRLLILMLFCLSLVGCGKPWQVSASSAQHKGGTTIPIPEGMVAKLDGEKIELRYAKGQEQEVYRVVVCESRDAARKMAIDRFENLTGSLFLGNNPRQTGQAITALKEQLATKKRILVTSRAMRTAGDQVNIGYDEKSGRHYYFETWNNDSKSQNANALRFIEEIK